MLYKLNIWIWSELLNKLPKDSLLLFITAQNIPWFHKQIKCYIKICKRVHINAGYRTNRPREYIKLYNKLTATWEIQRRKWTHTQGLPRYTVVESNKNTSDKTGRKKNTK